MPEEPIVFKHLVPFVHPDLDANGTWYMNGTVKTLFPKNHDWRTLGGVQPVRDQGNCGGCWAFGTAAVLESRLNILNNKKHF